MTPMAAHPLLTAALTRVPTLPPVAWSPLITRALTHAIAALRRNNPLDAQDQARLTLAYHLSHAGAVASWAQAPAHRADRRQAQWMACGRWHHDVQMTLHASQEPALVAGLPTPLTLDATQITPTPAFARLSTAAQAWLIRLTGDPLALSASLAAEGWTTLATGLWITPP